MRKSVRSIRAVTVVSVAVLALSGCGPGSGDAPHGPVPSTNAELYEQAMANRERFWKELDDREKVIRGEGGNADERIADNC